MQTSRPHWSRASLCAVFLCATLGCSLAAAQSFDSGLTPVLPAPCSNLTVPTGHAAAFRTYARGVQVYRWDGQSWLLVAPEADLTAATNMHLKVGTHYAGPTWDNGFGKVIGNRVASCSPNSTAIPWLLVKGIWTKGFGPFSKVTYIQRINTFGGIAPASPGTELDQIAEVPYTTEYVFYHADKFQGVQP
jgi:hypothetical protein